MDIDPVFAFSAVAPYAEDLHLPSKGFGSTAFVIPFYDLASPEVTGSIRNVRDTMSPRLPENSR